MNRLHLILLSFMFISCVGNQVKDNINKEVSNVTNAFIEDNSLYKYGVIFNKFAPYEYYEIKYTSSGKEIPNSEFNYALKNEKILLKIIDSKKFFDPVKNSDILKQQILQSKITFSDFTLDLDYLKSKNYAYKDTLTSFTLYPPLFNSDSTAAYIQYDFFDYGIEDGIGTVYIKKNSEWFFHKNVSSHLM
jgi:hypothetical protein